MTVGLTIASGTGALIQGKSVEQATKQMLGADEAPAPGLRMTGNYIGQTGFGITFHPESATLSCGEAAHALRYSIERSTNQTFLKVQDNANPLTMQLKPDGSLVGDGTIQVNGRTIVGTTEDPNPFIYSPKIARCTVGTLESRYLVEQFLDRYDTDDFFLELLRPRCLFPPLLPARLRFIGS